MKKIKIFLVLLLLSFVLSSCEELPIDSETVAEYETKISNLLGDYAALEAEVNDLQDDIAKLENDNSDLKAQLASVKSDMLELETLSNTLELSLVDLEVSFNSVNFIELQSQINNIQSIDFDAYSSLFDIQDDVDTLYSAVNSVQDSIYIIESYDISSIGSISNTVDSLTAAIDTINSFDLSQLSEISDTVDSLTTSIESINTTLTLLGTTGDNEVEELRSELEIQLQEINVKLNSLRSFDLEISNYSLLDSKVQELMFNVSQYYDDNEPSFDIRPERSSEPSTCDAGTYELCYTDNTLPKLYSESYNVMVEQRSFIHNFYDYIEVFDNFISQFPDNEIPVFMNEVDTYDNGEIKYTARTASTSEYQMTFEDHVNNKDYRFDILFSVLYDENDYYKITLKLDIKEEIAGLFFTDQTYELLIYINPDTMTPYYLSIRETDYPVNHSISFVVNNDISKMFYYNYDELQYEEWITIAYNEDSAYLYGQGTALNPELTSYFREEAYSMDDGLVLYETNKTYVPISFYNNWKEIYYREDGELTKIKISKIILDDNSEMIISDEQYSDSYTKAWKDDFIIYDDHYDPINIDDYLVINQGSSSGITQNMTKNDNFITSLNNIDSINLDDQVFESTDMKFDITPFTYGQDSTRTEKSKSDVYNDALRILEIAETTCTSSYCYYDNYIDRYMVGDLENDYYNLSSVYVYYPSSNKTVYLYAIYSGDYEFYGKNPLNYDEDDVTINP